MTRWRTVGTALSDEPIDVGGENPWLHEWRRLDEPDVDLPHPQYPQQLHSMQIYDMDVHGRRIRFAAGELSNGVWGFYVSVDAD